MVEYKLEDFKKWVEEKDKREGKESYEYSLLYLYLKIEGGEIYEYSGARRRWIKLNNFLNKKVLDLFKEWKSLIDQAEEQKKKKQCPKTIKTPKNT